MSCFKLSDSFCAKIESLMAQFWWRQKNNERKIYWISWKKLCDPKIHGGMSFESLKTFNITLLAKQGWRTIQIDKSLLHKLYKGRYFPHGQLFEAKLGTNPLYVWRGIWEAKNVLLNRSWWRIGDGLSVKIWHEPWVPGFNTLNYPTHLDEEEIRNMT